MNFENIPKELQKLKRWVIYKKENKIPLNAKTGYGAKSNDESTWATFEDAKRGMRTYKCDGVGFMLGSGYFGVDIDKAIGVNDQIIAEFVDTLKSYTEVSQSGKGIHIICRGVLPLGARRKGNVEMYDSNRYFALTGELFPSPITGVYYDGVVEQTEGIKPLWDKYLNSASTSAGYIYTKGERNIGVSTSLSDKEVVDKAQESANGNLFSCLYYGQWEGLYLSQSEADMAFCSILAFWTGKNASQMDNIFRGSKLYRDKWDTKRGERTYGQITIANAIHNCRDTYTATSTQSGVYNPLTGKVVNNKSYDLNDTGNAQRFVDIYGQNLRYNFDNKVWLIWDGSNWNTDNKQLVKTLCDTMIEKMKEEAIKEPNDKKSDLMLKNIKHLSSNSGKEAMLKEAMHIGEVPSVNADFNKDKFLLNCKNGIVDLKTGKISAHKRELLCSLNTQVECDLDKEPTLFIKSMSEIFRGDKELLKFFQKSLGYSLSGSTKEQCLFQCYGNGSNGKSMIFNIIYAIMGDYAINVQIESILSKNNSGNANSDIARMNGARFVRTTEPNEGVRFNEGLVKQLVGGDVITARFLYGKEFEFFPEFKIWIACNHKIVVRGTDFGIWRRMRLMPFLAQFSGETDNKNLETQLKNELPQILGWAVKGCLMWQKEGLELPKSIEDATKIYKNEMDVIASFMTDCTKNKPSAREKSADLFKAYKKWAMDGNEYLMSQTKFGIELAKHFEKINVRGYVYYKGVLLKEHDTSYIYEKDR